MKKRILSLLPPALAAAVALCAQTPATAAPAVYGATGEYQFNGHYYRLYTGPADPESARKTAVRDGGYLAEINSEAENSFLAECFAAYVGKFLIGAARNSGGEWLAAPGKPLAYSNWTGAADSDGNGDSPLNAVIEFQQSNGKWEPLPPSAKANGFVVEFNTIPKPRQNIFVGAIPGYVPEMEADGAEDAESDSLSDLPSGGISANLLFGRHVYADGVFRERYVDKEVTVAGIARAADIREITADDPVWSKYQGKFFMRLLGDNVICFLNNKPPLEGDTPAVIVKVHGKIAKGPQFRQVILEDARFINHRRIQNQRRLPAGKPDEEATQAGGMLLKFDDLLNRGTFELQTNQEGAIVSCTLDADPDGYGIELYWLKRLTGIEKPLFVALIGAKPHPEEPESPLVNCRIVGWGDRKPENAPPPPPEDSAR